MIEVLIVEDSLVMRQLLTRILEQEEGLHVMGWASSGAEALRFLEARKPDVITMDITMPGMDGFETTKKIMESTPLPIVIVSASTQKGDVLRTFQALEAGALAIASKPKGPGHPDFLREAKDLQQKVRLMSEVKVIRRIRRPGDVPAAAGNGLSMGRTRPAVVGIGASTGGPPVLAAILNRLSPGYPAPILVVQHMGCGFVQGFAEWLGTKTGLPVSIPSNGERMAAGRAYVAPEDAHMGVGRAGEVMLSAGPMEHGMRPAVSHLFRSIADVYGRSGVGVLLTGMGKDGAKELRKMREAGAFTIAQDKESSTVFGMPGEAVRLDAAEAVLSTYAIGDALASLAEGNQ